MFISCWLVNFFTSPVGPVLSRGRDREVCFMPVSTKGFTGQGDESKASESAASVGPVGS